MTGGVNFCRRRTEIGAFWRPVFIHLLGSQHNRNREEAQVLTSFFAIHSGSVLTAKLVQSLTATYNWLRTRFAMSWPSSNFYPPSPPRMLPACATRLSDG